VACDMLITLRKSMSKSLLYIIILLETAGLFVLSTLLVITISSPAGDSTTTASDVEPAVPITAREMTVYVKATGAGDRTTDAVGKVYVQDDATGRSEFLFDLGAGCFPTWELDTQDGYNLMVAEDVDIDSAPLDQLMREGHLRHNFRVNGDLEIRKFMGIRSVNLRYNEQVLRLNQQCS